MSLSVKVTITGDKEVMRKLRKLGDSINNMPDAMNKIGKYAVNYYRTIGFTDRGRPWGQEWRDLSQAYKVRKEKKYGTASRILVAKGIMQDSFYAEHNGHQVIIGNRAKYYKYHQSSATRHKLPRRQMAGINNPIKREIQSIIKDEITHKLRSA